MYLAASSALCGCFAKETPVCDIEVSTEKDSYAVGEEVVFTFSGNADNIVFYSGEPGHLYDRRAAHFADNPLKVKFRTATDGVLVGGKPDNNFRFLVSTDFNGVFDAENVRTATWKDLTESFGVAAEGGLVNTDSQELDLKELLPETAEMENPPFYLAFRYYDKDPEAPVKNRWVVRTYSVKSVGTDGEETRARRQVADYGLADDRARNRHGDGEALERRRHPGHGRGAEKHQLCDTRQGRMARLQGFLSEQGFARHW